MKLQNLYGIIGLHCDHCGAELELFFSNNLNATELNQTATTKARANGWIVTRDGRAYCKECQEKKT